MTDQATAEHLLLCGLQLRDPKGHQRTFGIPDGSHRNYLLFPKDRLGHSSLMKSALLVALVFLAGCSGNSPTGPTPIPPPVVVVPPVVTPPTGNPLLSDPRFDLGFYHQFTTRPLYRWVQAPKVYLRTVDDRGPVDPSLIERTAAAFINTASQWTGGSFGLAGLERGTETREGQEGWITVFWLSAGSCGSATITRTTAVQAILSVRIEMNAARPECTCGPLTAKHELGHAMGYQHTDHPSDLMVAEFTPGQCDKPLSDRERFHTTVAYSMAPGSMEP